jgi:hypothetical protein
MVRKKMEGHLPRHESHEEKMASQQQGKRSKAGEVDEVAAAGCPRR